MQRYRLQYSFWLNHNNPEDVMVADTVERLKNQRSFTQVVKDGIMLIQELKQGKTELLVRLFPEIVAKLTPPPAGGGGGDLEKQIADLKHIILQQGIIPAAPANYPVMKPVGPQPLGGFKAIAAPVDDDDYKLLTSNMKKAAPSTDAGRNLIKGLGGFLDARKPAKQGGGVDR